MGVAHAGLLVVQIGPEKQFLEVLPNFFGTTALQQKLLILIESPKIFHWKSTKKKKVGVVLGAKFGPN